MATIASQLKSILPSATELREMTGWPEPLIEDYLNLFENMVLLGGSADDSATKLPTAPEDNIIVFAADGDLKDSGESVNTIRARSYFYGRVY